MGRGGERLFVDSLHGVLEFVLKWTTRVLRFLERDLSPVGDDGTYLLQTYIRQVRAMWVRR